MHIHAYTLPFLRLHTRTHTYTHTHTRASGKNGFTVVSTNLTINLKILRYRSENFIRPLK